MNKKNRVLVILLIIIIILLAFLAFKPRGNMNVSPTTSVVPYGQTTPITNSNENGYVPPVSNQTPTTSVSTKLPAYIGGQENWPPVITHSQIAYSCTLGIGNRDMNEKVEQKTINNRVYCVKSSSDGAMGHIYYTYTYTTPSSNGNGTETTNFTLGYSSCGGYGGPGDKQYDDCKAAESSFNIDTVIDNLIQR